MQEQNSINFIKDINEGENVESIIEINDETSSISNNVSDTANNVTVDVKKNEEIITDLPKWDINPPLEVNRGVK